MEINTGLDAELDESQVHPSLLNSRFQYGDKVLYWQDLDQNQKQRNIDKYNSQFMADQQKEDTYNDKGYLDKLSSQFGAGVKEARSGGQAYEAFEQEKGLSSADVDTTVLELGEDLFSDPNRDTPEELKESSTLLQQEANQIPRPELRISEPSTWLNLPEVMARSVPEMGLNFLSGGDVRKGGLYRDENFDETISGISLGLYGGLSTGVDLATVMPTSPAIAAGKGFVTALTGQTVMDTVAGVTDEYSRRKVTGKDMGLADVLDIADQTAAASVLPNVVDASVANATTPIPSKASTKLQESKQAVNQSFETQNRQMGIMDLFDKGVLRKDMERSAFDNAVSEKLREYDDQIKTASPEQRSEIAARRNAFEQESKNIADSSFVRGRLSASKVRKMSESATNKGRETLKNSASNSSIGAIDFLINNGGELTPEMLNYKLPNGETVAKAVGISKSATALKLAEKLRGMGLFTGKDKASAKNAKVLNSAVTELKSNIERLLADRTKQASDAGGKVDAYGSMGNTRGQALQAERARLAKKDIATLQNLLSKLEGIESSKKSLVDDLTNLEFAEISSMNRRISDETGSLQGGLVGVLQQIQEVEQLRDIVSKSRSEPKESKIGLSSLTLPTIGAIAGSGGAALGALAGAAGLEVGKAALAGVGSLAAKKAGASGAKRTIRRSGIESALNSAKKRLDSLEKGVTGKQIARKQGVAKLNSERRKAKAQVLRLTQLLKDNPDQEEFEI